jgi:hypothetical protein
MYQAATLGAETGQPEDTGKRQRQHHGRGAATIGAETTQA